MQNKKRRIFALLLCLCVFLSTGCGLFAKEPAPAPPADEEKPPTQEIIVPNETPAPPAEDAEQTETPQEGTQQNKPSEKPASKQTSQSKPFWQSETSLHIQNLSAVAAAAQQDYKMTGQRRCWISKNGKLYSYNDGYYITPDALRSEGYLEAGVDTEGYEILLLKGADIAKYEGASVPADSMAIGVFAAVKQDSKYLIASPAGKVGQLSQESYTSLLAGYNQSHGMVGRLSSRSAEYDRILNYICLYEGKFEDFFVREVRKDNKYAVVTLSTTADTSAIKQYILRNDNAFWEVVYPNVQLDAYPIYAINRLVPDFNAELLPRYNLASWRSYVKTEQGGAVAALFSIRAISSQSEIWYQCATAECAYFRLTDGRRYAAYLDGDSWRAEQMESDVAAKNFLIQKTGVDYGFLILDD